MDKIIDKIAALGIPGIILLVAISVVGPFGAAAITTALATLGGPAGMLGGIAFLGVIGLISKGIADYGFEKILTKSMEKLKSEKGFTEEEVIEKINSLPITKGLKLKLIDKIKNPN